jgi:integrase
MAVKAFDVVEVQHYMGHAHISTTMRYAHHAPRVDAAAKLTEAFNAGTISSPTGSRIA